jgi:hypothetical protein
MNSDECVMSERRITPMPTVGQGRPAQLAGHPVGETFTLATAFLSAAAEAASLSRA